MEWAGGCDYARGESPPDFAISEKKILSAKLPADFKNI